MTDHLNNRSAPQPVSRRDMLKVGLGAGGTLLWPTAYRGSPEQISTRVGREDRPRVLFERRGRAPFPPNAFIRIGADRQVTLTMPYVEMGHGTYTSIPMLMAEELEVDGQVTLEHARPTKCSLQIHC